jgi:DEAD/DEAH box helicase domain-containing protein
VGGPANIAKLRLACAVTWSSAKGEFSVYWEPDVGALVDELKSADKVVGFNLLGFDYKVLQPYIENFRLASLPTLDMLDDIRRILGFRLSLDAIAGATLGAHKTADGLQSVSWFRAGELDKVAQYCKADVEITRRVFEYGRDHGQVFYRSKLGGRMKVLVKWS